MEERLQKYLAQCGVASRRKCEEFKLMGLQLQNLEQKLIQKKTKLNLMEKI